MSFADDLTTMLDSPFGVTISAGGVSAKGILNQPTSLAVGDSIIYTDFVLFCEASKFGSVATGSTMTVDGTAYEVREVQKTDDGLEAQISLSKT